MGKNRHIIKSIEPGSIAEEMELVPGDELLTVNGEEIEIFLITSSRSKIPMWNWESAERTARNGFWRSTRNMTKTWELFSRTV